MNLYNKSNVTELKVLTGKTFQNVEFTDIDFTLLKGMMRAEFNDCRFKNCNFERKKLKDLKVYNSLFDSCAFINTDLLGSCFDRTVFKNCQFERSNWNRTEVLNSEFVDCKFSYDSGFHYAIFTNVLGFPERYLKRTGKMDLGQIC
ncbi:pentapeptide repeat-containing protein [Pseudoalteromonas aurantia]|uniref:pentapeptide repeat-containing protein n=1 Tax=Pseudoalteromonas aurantia TaxID=43654 RepID=UPI00148673F9|nr:pentapeptide repeat-containing protein [Pseudoalteromonas aurantia]